MEENPAIPPGPPGIMLLRLGAVPALEGAAEEALVAPVHTWLRLT